jgi:chromosome partitioning protein
MGRVIAVASQKGGVGKTTTTINLGACLAQSGQKVLIVDVDPQGNASSGLGINGNDQSLGVYEALLGPIDMPRAIVPTSLEGLGILTSGQRLSGAEVELVGMIARETRLRGVIAPLRDQYDFILIDCPPSLGLLTVNALTAADSVLIPLQCEYLALEGLTQLIAAIRLVQDHLNPALRIEGVLLTMFDVRLNLSQQVVDEARKFFSDRVYRTVIPRSVRLGEAPSFGKPIVQYDPHSTGAERYRELAQEVLERAEVSRSRPVEASAALAGDPGRRVESDAQPSAERLSEQSGRKERSRAHGEKSAATPRNYEGSSEVGPRARSGEAAPRHGQAGSSGVDADVRLAGTGATAERSTEAVPDPTGADQDTGGSVNAETVHAGASDTPEYSDQPAAMGRADIAQP